MKQPIYGQNFRFGFYEVEPSKRMKAIKNAGFDAVMFWWGDEFENTDGNRYDLFNMAQKENLLVSTIHFPTTYSDALWYDTLYGED